MAIRSTLRPRWLPKRSFPPYAYLPGRQPHPVRDPAGHSYQVEPVVSVEATLDSDPFLWGLDLFNHGYYWEAHEAWEGLWQIARRGDPLRILFKGLILLSAAGVKIRADKDAAAVHHAGRAAERLRRLTPDPAFERALGMSPSTLAENAEAAVGNSTAVQATAAGQPQPVFDFILGSRGLRRESLTRSIHPWPNDLLAQCISNPDFDILANSTAKVSRGLSSASSVRKLLEPNGARD